MFLSSMRPAGRQLGCFCMEATRVSLPMKLDTETQRFMEMDSDENRLVFYLPMLNSSTIFTMAAQIIQRIAPSRREAEAAA